MRLTGIDIKNFRGFDSLKVEDFGQVNLIIGKNNSGKTSLMEAILLPLSSTYPLTLFNLNQIREIGVRSLDSLRGFFYGLSFDSKPEVKATFINKEGELKTRRVIISASIDLNDSLTTVKQAEHVDRSDALINFSSSSYINKIDVKTYLEDGREVPLSIIYDLDNNLSVQHSRFTDSSQSAIFLPSTATEEPAVERLGYLIREKKKQQLIDVLGRIDSRIKDIQVIDRKVYFDFEGVDSLLSFSLVGDGIKKVVSVIASVIDTTFSTAVFIDEIENGLHYSAQLKLWEALLDIVKTTETQLFISTHNIETLSYLQEALSKNEAMQPAVRVFNLALTQKAGFKAYKYTYEGLSDAIENETEIRL